MKPGFRSAVLPATSHVVPSERGAFRMLNPEHTVAKA